MPLRSPLAVLLLAACCAGAQDFDPAALAPPANLVNNPSFEGDPDKNGVPDGWSFYANAKYSRLSDEKALHGTHSILVDRPTLEGIVHVAADQWVPILPGHVYTLTAWVNVERCEGGFVKAYLDYYDAERQRLTLKEATLTAPTDGWVPLTVSLEAPAEAAFARLLVPYIDGNTRAFTDAVTLTSATGGSPPQLGEVSGLRVERSEPYGVSLAWDSDSEQHEVLYRRPGAEEWTVDPTVWADSHTVINLEPDTDYELAVRAVLPSSLGPDGEVVGGGAAAATAPVTARTTAVAPRVWEGLRLWPTRHFDTFPEGQAYPCIEYHDGSLYVVECQSYALYLSKVNPVDFSAEWTKKIVSRVDGPSTYQGIPDTVIHDGKLWVMWNRQATGRADYHIRDSRQLFLTYDLATGEVSEPTVIEPTTPNHGTWEGGLDVLDGRLWMMWLEVDTNEQGRRRTKVVMRPYENGAFGERVVYDNCPSAYPYGPSISPFNGRLILLWSDLEELERTPDHEPLYATFFDGQSFGEAHLLNDVGRNRYAKGTQVGDDFYCVYKCSSAYPRSNYMYHDLALTRIGNDGEHEATAYWVDDVKYNSSPDMTRLGEALYVVYGKFEHAYGNRRDPARNFGTYWGRIELGE